MNQLQPDLVGFVFAKGRHQVDAQKAKELRNQLDPNIKAVGVFVDTPIQTIKQLYQAQIIQVAQLHGGQSESAVTELMDSGIPVIKVFKPAKQPVTATAADYVMVDSGNGSGKPLDWQSLQFNFKQPLMVAGGLTPTNAIEAINNLHPDYLDVSSGVETNGTKDAQLVESIITTAHKN
nr:phosphoribosylanthranilate isomerase [Lactobacillus sp. Sy-1]